MAGSQLAEQDEAQQSPSGAETGRQHPTVPPHLVRSVDESLLGLSPPQRRFPSETTPKLWKQGSREHYSFVGCSLQHREGLERFQLLIGWNQAFVN